MPLNPLFIFVFLLSTVILSAQNGLLPPEQQDSICKYGKKYIKPKRLTPHFPAKNVSYEYKLSELHRAIPDSFKNDTTYSNKQWLYDYYFSSDHLIDYDPKKDSIVTLPKERLTYILRDSYFFDMNGDGLLDFIHYPAYYMPIMRDSDEYELFLKQKNGGYKILQIHGFITHLDFNKDGTLHTISSYQGACCNDNHHFFYVYTFDKSTNSLTLTKHEQVLTCQFQKK
jgi:hypothetical protein